MIALRRAVRYNDTMKTLCAILIFAVLTAAWMFRYDPIDGQPRAALDRWSGELVALPRPSAPSPR